MLVCSPYNLGKMRTVVQLLAIFQYKRRSNDGADSEVEAIDDDDLSPNEPADVCGEIDIFTRLTDSKTEGAKC